jgi:putative sterol carrier protein
LKNLLISSIISTTLNLKDATEVEVKTPTEFFEEKLPTKFNPSKVRGLNAIIQMNITGSEGGQWAITIKNESFSVLKGSDRNPTMIITVADKDFVDLINGKMSGERAFMSGKLKFDGDFSVALRLLQSGLL